jgi:hypothetical protein
MDNWMTTTSTTPPAPLTDAAIAELKAKLGPMPRDVFLYPGPIGRFLADLEASGVEIRGVEIQDPGVPPTPFGLPPIGGLECWEVDGQVWIAGSVRDLRYAREGRIPVKPLRSGAR